MNEPEPPAKDEKAKDDKKEEKKRKSQEAHNSHALLATFSQGAGVAGFKVTTGEGSRDPTGP